MEKILVELIQSEEAGGTWYYVKTNGNCKVATMSYAVAREEYDKFLRAPERRKVLLSQEIER